MELDERAKPHPASSGRAGGAPGAPAAAPRTRRPPWGTIAPPRPIRTDTAELAWWTARDAFGPAPGGLRHRPCPGPDDDRPAAQEDGALARLRYAVRAARKRQCLGRYGEAAALGESALRWARRAGATEGERASVLGVLGFSLLYGPEPVSSAVPRLRTLLSRYGDQGPACRLALAGPLVLLHAMQGRDSLARAALVLARSAAAEADPRCGAVLLSVLEARLESLAGRTTRSARHLAEARDAAASLGLGPVRDAVRWASVRLLTDAGRYEEAARRLAAGGSPVVRTEGRGVACSVDTAGPAGLLARLAAAEGRAEDARALADRAVGEAAASDSPLVHALARLDQAEVLRLAGRGEAARYAVCLAGEGFARKGHVPGVRDAAARHAALAPAARRR